MKKSVSFVIFIIYALFGLYFLNGQLSFINIPETFVKGDVWITFVGGILLIFAGIKFLTTKKAY